MISEKRLEDVKHIASNFPHRESLIGEAGELLDFHNGMSPEPFDSAAASLWTRYNISWGMALATVLKAYQQREKEGR